MTTPSSVGQPDCALTWDSFYLGVELEAVATAGGVAWSYDSQVPVAVVDSANAWGGWAYALAAGEGG